jgi:large subunit ribosomal protein L24
MKIKVNDTVKVTGGKDKGKQGQVTKVFPRTDRVIVKGMNTYKRHMKKQSDKNPGGIIQIERPLPVANVMVVCQACKQAVRVGYEVVGDAKTRICKKCRAAIKGA